MYRNKRIVLIEGDETIDPSAIRIICDDLDIDFVYACRDDNAAIEPVDTSVEPDRIQRVASAIEMQKLLASLKRIMRARLKAVEDSLDRLEPDTDAAIAALSQLEREIADARSRISAVGATKKAQEEAGQGDTSHGKVRRSDD